MKDIKSRVSFKTNRTKLGGLISIWDPQYIVKEDVFEGIGFVRVVGKWEGLEFNCYTIKQLCYNRSNRVNIFLEDLQILHDNESGYMCLMKDFNIVANMSERGGHYGNRVEMEDFDNFIKRGTLKYLSNEES